jgi:hypothetical protein
MIMQTAIINSCSFVNLTICNYLSVSFAMKTKAFSKYFINISLNCSSWFTGVIFTNFSFIILWKLNSRFSIIYFSLLFWFEKALRKVLDSRRLDILTESLAASYWAKISASKPPLSLRATSVWLISLCIVWRIFLSLTFSSTYLD